MDAKYIYTCLHILAPKLTKHVGCVKKVVLEHCSSVKGLMASRKDESLPDLLYVTRSNDYSSFQLQLRSRIIWHYVDRFPADSFRIRH